VRKNGQTVDPFAPKPDPTGACAPQAPLWNAEAARAMAYKSGVLLNFGFAGTPVTTMEILEAGNIALPSANGAVLGVYARSIGLQAGDEIELTILGPDGKAVAERRDPALKSDKAQQFTFIGRKRPASGWKPGTYKTEYKVMRAGKAVIDSSREFTL